MKVFVEFEFDNDFLESKTFSWAKWWKTAIVSSVAQFYYIHHVKVRIEE